MIPDTDSILLDEYRGALGDGNPHPQQLHSNLAHHSLFITKTGASKPWATLKLTSRPGKTPYLIGGDSVKGVLELKLENATSIHSLTLNIKGRLIAKSEQLNKRELVFLNHKHELYSKTTDPSHSGQCKISRNRKHDGKMQGIYHFPFSFPFPTTVTVELGGGQDEKISAVYSLPPTFAQGSGVTVRYEVILIAGYGKLRMNDRVSTNVVYVPKVIAPPAPEKRQLAYLGGKPLPTPTGDPAGWISEPSVVLTGNFQGRKTQLSCSLWLAKPLCYARGTVLPCYLSLSGVDSQLLDHLTESPGLIDLRLLRYINYCGDIGPSVRSPYQMSANEEETEVVQTAVWWKPKSGEPEDPEVRRLEGEIHLPSTLLPSCDYRLLIVRYGVEMMPFLSESFIRDNREGSHPIIRQPVEIATYQESGPMPISFSARRENAETVGIPARGGLGLIYNGHSRGLSSNT